MEVVGSSMGLVSPLEKTQAKARSKQAKQHKGGNKMKEDRNKVGRCYPIIPIWYAGSSHLVYSSHNQPLSCNCIRPDIRTKHGSWTHKMLHVLVGLCSPSRSHVRHKSILKVPISTKKKGEKKVPTPKL